jgi:hypothetical protein
VGARQSFKNKGEDVAVVRPPSTPDPATGEIVMVEKPHILQLPDDRFFRVCQPDGDARINGVAGVSDAALGQLRFLSEGKRQDLPRSSFGATEIAEQALKRLERIEAAK